MGRLIYGSITSLDGYVADEHGQFDWSMPSEEVHLAVNASMAGIGTYLYGRELYEVMAVWETMETSGEPPAIVDFARMWRQADKIVYSTTLEQPTTERTRLERDFQPDLVAELKASSEADLLVGGPTLASAALDVGLVDEIFLYLTPVTVGSGKHWLPGRQRLSLNLTAQKTFENGVCLLHYKVAPDPGEGSGAT